MKNILVTLTLSCCIFIACNNSNNTAANKSEVPADSGIQGTTTNISESPNQIPVTDNASGLSSESSPSSQLQSKAATAVGMNPAHGEPGHDCAIPVGAPLNSSKTATTASPAPVITTASPSVSAAPPAITSSPSAPVITPAPSKTAPGMNPPHGEPGHDCAVAVGAPLKK